MDTATPDAPPAPATPGRVIRRYEIRYHFAPDDWAEETFFGESETAAQVHAENRMNKHRDVLRLPNGAATTVNMALVRYIRIHCLSDQGVLVSG